MKKYETLEQMIRDTVERRVKQIMSDGEGNESKVREVETQAVKSKVRWVNSYEIKLVDPSARAGYMIPGVGYVAI